MGYDVIIKKFNETYIQLECSDEIFLILYEKFKLKKPVSQFSKKKWDGTIRFLDKSSKRMYYGLKEELILFLNSKKYTHKDLSIEHQDYDSNDIKSFLTGDNFLHTPRQDQYDAVLGALEARRVVVESSTSSGKSFMIYLITAFLNRHIEGKVLIVVPSILLVDQLTTDFKNYDKLNTIGDIHSIVADVEKDSDAKIYISTYQSIAELKKDYFLKFDLVVIDECHSAATKSITHILKSSENALFRFGFTGTLKSDPVTKMTIKGLIGNTLKGITAKELIVAEKAAQIKIKGVILDYPQEFKNYFKKRVKKYTEEVDFINNIIERKELICKICLKIPDDENILILLNRVEEIDIFQEILKDIGNKEVFVIKGSVSKKSRNETINFTEKNNGVVIIGTIGCMSTGVSINNLQHLILASSLKSEITIPQSIGRMMRKDNKKNISYIWDIVDNLMDEDDKYNYTLSHFFERVKLYLKSDFEFKTFRKNIKVTL
jgi:superfamily II DNA or RNA helicase